MNCCYILSYLLLLGEHVHFLFILAARSRVARAEGERRLLAVGGLAFQRSRQTSSMSSSQQSISTPLVIGEPLVGGFPTDMDVDDDNLALLDAHDTPSEKVDADFFNGELCHCARTLMPRATRLAPPAQQESAPSGTHVFLPTCPPQISRTTSTTTTWNEWHMRAYVRETLAQACLHTVST